MLFFNSETPASLLILSLEVIFLLLLSISSDLCFGLSLLSTCRRFPCLVFTPSLVEWEIDECPDDRLPFNGCDVEEELHDGFAVLGKPAVSAVEWLSGGLPGGHQFEFVLEEDVRGKPAGLWTEYILPIYKNY